MPEDMPERGAGDGQHRGAAFCARVGAGAGGARGWQDRLAAGGGEPGRSRGLPLLRPHLHDRLLPPSDRPARVDAHGFPAACPRRKAGRRPGAPRRSKGAPARPQWPPAARSRRRPPAPTGPAHEGVREGAGQSYGMADLARRRLVPLLRRSRAQAHGTAAPTTRGRINGDAALTGYCYRGAQGVLRPLTTTRRCGVERRGRACCSAPRHCSPAWREPGPRAASPWSTRWSAAARDEGGRGAARALPRHLRGRRPGRRLRPLRRGSPSPARCSTPAPRGTVLAAVVAAGGAGKSDRRCGGRRAATADPAPGAGALAAPAAATARYRPLRQTARARLHDLRADAGGGRSRRRLRRLRSTGARSHSRTRVRPRQGTARGGARADHGATAWGSS